MRLDVHTLQVTLGIRRKDSRKPSSRTRSSPQVLLCCITSGRVTHLSYRSIDSMLSTVPLRWTQAPACEDPIDSAYPYNCADVLISWRLASKQSSGLYILNEFSPISCLEKSADVRHAGTRNFLTEFGDDVALDKAIRCHESREQEVEDQHWRLLGP